jgi:hypothetical protein
MKRILLLVVIIVLGGLCATSLFAQNPNQNSSRPPQKPPKEVTIGTRKLLLNQTLPEDVKRDILTRKSAALNEVISVFEQTDWDLFDEIEDGQELTYELLPVAKDLFSTDEKTRDEVKKILKTGQKSNARLPIMRLLEQAKVKGPDMLPVAVAYSTDTDRRVRLNSVWILDNQESAEAIPLLKKIARTDTDKHVVNYAAKGLAKLNDPEGQKILINNLKDAVPAVRSSAADCLTEIKNPEVLKALEDALIAEQNGGVVATLVNALRFHTGLGANEIRKKYRGWTY